MKFFKKLKSSNFWVSMISAVVLILQAVFNVDIKTEYLSQIIMAMLGVLVMTGIVSDSPNSESTTNNNLNIENLTQSLGKIFTQIISSVETNMLSIVTQFEKIKESLAKQQSQTMTQSSVGLNLSTEESILEKNEAEQNFLDDKISNINLDNSVADIVEDLVQDLEDDGTINIDEPVKVEEKNTTSNLNVL